MHYDATPFPQTAQDLINARKLLIEEGWAGHNSAAGPYCIGMAIWLGLKISNDRKLDAQEALYTLFGGENPNDLFEWNDTPGRTFQEVLDLLDRAIEKAINDAT